MDTRANTGRRTEYIFKSDASGITILNGPRGGDPLYADYYHRIEGRGTTAIRRLMEEHASYRAFFQNVIKLAQLDPHDRLTGFVEVRDMDEEQQTSFERIAEIIEEVSDWEDND